MNPIAQLIEKEDEHLGFGVYFVERPWGDSYQWRGPAWSDAMIEGVSRACAAGMLFLGVWMVVQVVRRQRISEWRAYAFFGCAYVQGLMFTMASEDSVWPAPLGFTRALPAFVVLACVAALRRRPQWWAWIPIDLGAIFLLACFFLVNQNEIGPFALLFAIPWVLLWAVVRLRTRAARVVDGLQADAWRLLAAAQLVALIPLCLVSLTMNIQASDEIDFLVGGLVLCISMSAFLLGTFQIAINRRAHA